MCWPMAAAGAGTLATASTAASLASGVLGAFGAIQQGRAAQAQANYQAQVARNNRIYAERQAERVRQEGEVAAQETRRRARLAAGSARATLAGSGVDVGSGSAVDIAGDIAGFGEVDALTLRDRAETQATALEQQGANFGAQAGLFDASGRNARTSSFFNAGGSVLNSVGTVASRWYRFRREGVGSTTRGVG